MKSAKSEFLELAGKISRDERERILSRMRGKLPRLFFKDKLNEDQAIALQLEREDGDLKDWLDRVRKMREADGKNAAAKSRTGKPG